MLRLLERPLGRGKRLPQPVQRLHGVWARQLMFQHRRGFFTSVDEVPAALLVARSTPVVDAILHGPAAHAKEEGQWAVLDAQFAEVLPP